MEEHLSWFGIVTRGGGTRMLAASPPDHATPRNLDQLVACTVSYLRSRSPRRGVVGGRGGEHPRPPPPEPESEPGQVFLQASFARWLQSNFRSIMLKLHPDNGSGLSGTGEHGMPSASMPSASMAVCQGCVYTQADAETLFAVQLRWRLSIWHRRPSISLV